MLPFLKMVQYCIPQSGGIVHRKRAHYNAHRRPRRHHNINHAPHVTARRLWHRGGGGGDGVHCAPRAACVPPTMLCIALRLTPIRSCKMEETFLHLPPTRYMYHPHKKSSSPTSRSKSRCITKPFRSRGGRGDLDGGADLQTALPQPRGGGR
jgi:hypothetical protein